MSLDSKPGQPVKPAPGDTESSRGSRRRMFRCVAISMSLLLFLLLDLIVGSLVDVRNQESFRMSHPYYHHGLRPSQQRMTMWGGREYEMCTDSMGFRNHRPQNVPLHSDLTRVLLIGDSMIEGLGVEFEESVAGRLQSRWSRRNVDVLNAAVVSYSPHLYELRTRYLLEQEGLQFDQLVVFIDISDVQDELFYEAFRPELVPNPAEPRRGWWRRHSLVAGLFERLTSGRKRVNNTFRVDADVHVWMEGTDAYVNAKRDPELGRFEWTVDEDLYNQWGEHGLALARNHMEQLGALCRENNIDLTVVVYPSPVQIYAVDRDSMQVRFWRDFCAESGIRFINLFPEFIDPRYTGPSEVYRRFFIPDDVHWSPAGHRLVADVIAERLAETVTSDE